VHLAALTKKVLNRHNRENDWPQLFKILPDASAAGGSALRGIHFLMAK